MHTKTHKEKILSFNKQTNAQTNKQRSKKQDKTRAVHTISSVYKVHQSIFGDDQLFF